MFDFFLVMVSMIDWLHS